MSDQSFDSTDVFTPGDLQAAVVPSPELERLVSNQQMPGQITEAQMAELKKQAAATIRERLADAAGKKGSKNPNYTDYETATLTRMIVEALPIQMLSQPVVAQLDLRPYLDAMNGKHLQGTKTSKGGTAYVNNPTVDTTKYMTGETKRLQKMFDESGGTVPAFKVGQAGIAPGPTVNAVDTETGAVAPADPSSLVVDPKTGEFNIDASAQPGGQATFPVEDMVRLVQGGMYDMEQLVGAEAEQQKTNPDGFFPVEMNRHTTRTQNQQVLSPLDAINYLYTLTPKQVSSMQLKLASAGYFDQLDNGGFYKEGYAYDNNTMLAWKQLLQDSIANKVPVTQMLGERSKTYRETTRQARLRQLSQFDPRYSRVVANDYGQSVLGRNLTDDEAAYLDAQLKTLVKQRAGYVAGADNAGIDHALPNEQGYTENDVQAILANDRPMTVEERKNNLFKTSFALSKL